ncbi:MULTISPECIES: 4Fe-4S binding protein [unclassified Synechococcus]|uniref:4Fe-4S binding protein n=1 Tax=unclassified Synechococcus TaxID=2626047 RepID=UPI0021A4914B|nr:MULTISPECIES: 4Fe-4S binding protein [unclassified Synechococcus]MCT0212586.1 4Fe-4S binding protein [Synechococcus sp. CS-1326]MCT0232102.1 4Fe-4S binding protein [Synechococcus sp. CS-1327]
MTDSEPLHVPERFQRLAPHLVGRARRGIVGSSRYAAGLRERVRQAAADPERRPVLIAGEPGLEKDDVAALIHFGSTTRRHLMVQLDGALLRGDGAELFGSAGSDGVGSLLDDIGAGSLLINKLDRVDAALLPALLSLARSGDWSPPGAGSTSRRFAGRLFFTTETTLPDFDRCCSVIRVPPLRVRRQDLGEWLRYLLRLRSRALGWSVSPVVGEEVIRRLQIHDFPGNVRELEGLVERALRQVQVPSLPEAERNPPLQLPEEVFWLTPRPQRLRFDLWRWKPPLRQWMRSPRLWNSLLFGLVSWVFVLVNLWLWLGPQDRGHNGGLNMFWAWWWPLILLSYPLVGRLWCSFCPFMVWGEIVQRLARALGWQPASWPRGNTDAWAAPALAAGFAAILLWEELADLENSARLSSALLLLITAGAVIGSLRFEKRFWCRYLCPVGGMNGLFAKLSILELRAQQGTCSGSCSTYACFKGGPAEGEGLATAGCPLGTHPAHLADNRNCVLCLTCVQACPHRSVQLSLRPPAADLQREMAPPDGEAGLILVLAGGVCLKFWDRLLGGLPLAPDSLQAGPLLPRLAFAALALALPSALALLALRIGSWLAPPERAARRLRLGLYGLLPLLWGLLLARHLPVGMAEAGRLLPVSFQLPLPSWSADPHVIAFCQSLVLLVGGAGSWLVLRRLLLPSRRLVWLACLGALAIGVGGRWLVGVTL